MTCSVLFVTFDVWHVNYFVQPATCDVTKPCCERILLPMRSPQPVVAFPLSFLLAYIAVRTSGETDINPIGAMGKVMPPAIDCANSVFNL